MPVIKSFRDLEIYQEALTLAKIVNSAARLIPRDERELISQLRRCSRSTPALIAEGYGRKYSEKEFRKYLNEAVGECNEMEPHIEIAKDSGYWASDFSDDLMSRYAVLGKRIFSMATKWRSF